MTTHTAGATSPNKRFSYLQIAAIGSGFFGLSLVWAVYNTYMPLLLGRFTESAALRGAVMGLDNLLAVFLIPVVGAWSDRTSGPLGQRLPFIAVGMPAAALLLALLPLGATSLWTLLAADALFLLAMTLYRAPVIALMPDHTPQAKRSTANGIINLMGGIGGLLAFFILAPLYDLAPGYPFWLGAVLLLAAFVFLWFKTDRHPAYTEPAARRDGRAALPQLLRDAAQLGRRSNRSKLLVLCAIFFYFIGFSGLEAQFSTYATESLALSGGEAGLLLGFFSLAFVIAALPAGLLGTRMGKPAAMILGLLVLVPLFVVAPSIHAAGPLRLLLIAGGIAWALVNVQAYPLVADLGGATRIGFFTGMYYLFSMGASVLAPTLAGLAMDGYGQAALFYVCGTAFALGCLLLWLGTRSPFDGFGKPGEEPA
ncbi:MAG TPA: MFS transporter [Trueperaceae bacterium]